MHTPDSAQPHQSKHLKLSSACTPDRGASRTPRGNSFLAGWIIRALTSLVMFVSFMANGADVTLAWDPNSEPNVQGYRLHYGLRSGNYMGSLDVGNVTRSTAALPFGGETYFLSLTAYNTSQLHSDFSNEVSFRPPVKPGAVVNTNQLNLVTDGNGAVEIAWNSSAMDRATAVHYIAEPPTHGRIAGAASSLRYEPAPGFPGFDQCRLILVDINENVLKLEITIAPATVAKPINDGPTSFRPVDDAYLRGGTRFNSRTLRVEAGRRISYLKFNVSGLSGSVQSATLRLQERGNRGNGTLRVYRCNHNNWTESNLSRGKAPAESGQVGVYTGPIRSRQVVDIDVTPLVTGNGMYSVILKHDAGGNDVWFGSDESTTGPQLIIETRSNYTLTVNNGNGDGNYSPGTTVNIVAAAAPAGQMFDRWTGDVSNIASVTAASTSITMPSANATIRARYKSTARSAFTFRAIDDAYLRGGRGFNSSTLRVKAGRRISYLKFKVRGLSGSVQSATLRLQEHGNRGKGTLRVYRGRHNNWTESNLSHATAPAESGQVGVYTGRIRTGQVVNIDVTPLVTGNGTYSVILKQDAGANDVWFGSDETTRGPQLNILTTGGSTSSVTLTAIHGDGSDAGTTGQVGYERSRLELKWDATSGRWLVGWSGSNWVLQESLQPDSLWTDVPSPVSNPYPILLDGEYRFYRLRAAEEHGMQDGGSAAGSEPYSIRSDIESLGEPRRLGRE